MEENQYFYWCRWKHSFRSEAPFNGRIVDSIRSCWMHLVVLSIFNRQCNTGDNIYYCLSTKVFLSVWLVACNDGSRRNSLERSPIPSYHLDVFITMTFIFTVVYYCRTWYYNRCSANGIFKMFLVAIMLFFNSMAKLITIFIVQWLKENLQS